jgi:hypothetical protein
MNRRQFARVLSGWLLLGAAMKSIGCTRRNASEDSARGRRDWFADGSVCLHVYDLREPLPAALLDANRSLRGRPAGDGIQAGLPEVLVCTSPGTLLDGFPDFWPFTKDDLHRLERMISVEFRRQRVRAEDDVASLEAFLRNARDGGRRAEDLAVVLTVNDHTIPWLTRLARISQEVGARELAVIKDPSHPPYLCLYPTRQKGPVPDLDEVPEQYRP